MLKYKFKSNMGDELCFFDSNHFIFPEKPQSSQVTFPTPSREGKKFEGRLPDTLREGKKFAGRLPDTFREGKKYAGKLPDTFREGKKYAGKLPDTSFGGKDKV